MAMHTAITCARAALTPDNAVAEIDRVLTEVRDRRLPGYLLVPADVAQAPATAAARPLPRPTDTTDPDALDAFVDAARRLLDRAGVGRGHQRARRAAGAPVRRGPAAATSAGRRPGAARHDPVGQEPGRRERARLRRDLLGRDRQHGADPAHRRGRRRADPRRRPVHRPQQRAVQPADHPRPHHRARRPLGQRRGGDLRAAGAADRTGRAGAAGRRPRPVRPAGGHDPGPGPAPAADDAPLSQATLWQETAGFLQAGDIVLADQGTCFYGMAPHRLPADVTFVGQPLWASIGYTLPALLGACTARPGRRGVLLIGDGAAQLTVQELPPSCSSGCPRSWSWWTTTATRSSARSTAPTSRTTTSPAGLDPRARLLRRRRRRAGSGDPGAHRGRAAGGLRRRRRAPRAAEPDPGGGAPRRRSRVARHPHPRARPRGTHDADEQVDVHDLVPPGTVGDPPWRLRGGSGRYAARGAPPAPTAGPAP